MKIIMIMGIPGSNNLELATYIKLNKYPQALIFNRDEIRVKTKYRNLSSNSPIIDFAFIRFIKNELQKTPTNCIIIVAPFVLKITREYFFEAFQENEFIGV